MGRRAHHQTAERRKAAQQVRNVLNMRQSVPKKRIQMLNIGRNWKEPAGFKPYTIPSSKLCPYCNVVKFPKESPNICCGGGAVKIARPDCPPELRDLFERQDEVGKEFRKNIRGYNQLFAFTSLRVNIDRGLASASKGIYTFRAHGQVYHQIGDMLPAEEAKPKFLQLYVYDTDNEAANRHQTAPFLQPGTIKILQDMLHRVNPYVANLKTISNIPDVTKYQLSFKADTGIDQRVYNEPSASQVGMIWVEGNDPSNIGKRDIVLHPRDGGPLQRISEISSAYDPLQYPLLFPLGESGWNPALRSYVGDS